jgi:hypothetical protein
MTDAESAFQKSGSTLPASLSASLPPGSKIQQIAFVSERTAGQSIVWEAPLSLQRRAVLVPGAAQPQSGETVDLTLLTVPAPVGEAATEAESELFSTMRQWVDAAASTDAPPSQVMMFQGTQLCWTPERVALLIPADRLESVRRVLIEAAFYEQELRRIERTLGENWPQLESDMPLAFEVEERSMSQQQQLRQRFGQVLLLRAGLARLGPYVHSPHLHPPTLASQMGERLRDRTRMEHRYEFLDEQIEVFEDVYDMCGQRASDFKLARTGHLLEWAIIVLLVMQLLLSCFEILTSVGQ